MAKVYKRVPGGKIESVIARHRTVQARLDTIAFERGIRAEVILNGHRDRGDSQIDVDRGDVDRYVSLSDERGQWAAGAIEFGRKPGVDEDGNATGGSEGVWALHDAFGLPHRGR